MKNYKELVDGLEPKTDDMAFISAVLKRGKNIQSRGNLVMRQLAPVMTALVILFGGGLVWAAYNGQLTVAERNTITEDDRPIKQPEEQPIEQSEEFLITQSFPQAEENVSVMGEQLGLFVFPVEGGVISELFGDDNDYYTSHGGIDISAPYGTEIIAAGNGKVISAEWSNGYGNAVIIDHGNGFTTLYAHCNRLLVSADDTVSQGDVIAEVGSTGYTYGNMLHFEVRYGEQLLNPIDYLPDYISFDIIDKNTDEEAQSRKYNLPVINDLNQIAFISFPVSVLSSDYLFRTDTGEIAIKFYPKGTYELEFSLYEFGNDEEPFDTGGKFHLTTAANRTTDFNGMNFSDLPSDKMFYIKAEGEWSEEIEIIVSAY